MSDSYTSLLYHIVFSTKDRRPLITSEIEPQLYDYIGGIIRGLGGICLELNGTEDHVHLLAKLRPDCALSDILRELKANATGWMHDVFPELKLFMATRVWRVHGESIKRGASERVYSTTERASHEDLFSRRIHTILEGQWY